MTAIYSGSFDPVTNGHMDVIIRSSKLFDKIIVAILRNCNKNFLFSVEERITHLQELTKEFNNIEVMSFTGLLVDFAKMNNANVIIRGFRTPNEYDYEFTMAVTNRTLAPNIETIFLPASTKYLFLSSSAVKQAVTFGGEIGEMVPSIIKESLLTKFEK